MEIASVVGSLAAICSTISFAPQAWQIIKTRDTESISLSAYVVTVIGFSLWLLYGILRAEWPIIASNAICLGLASFILFMKIVPQREKEAISAALDPTD
jgi:MtN3 and saliva related transmembrane protein